MSFICFSICFFDLFFDLSFNCKPSCTLILISKLSKRDSPAGSGRNPLPISYLISLVYSKVLHT